MLSWLHMSKTFMNQQTIFIASCTVIYTNATLLMQRPIYTPLNNKCLPYIKNPVTFFRCRHCVFSILL